MAGDVRYDYGGEAFMVERGIEECHHYVVGNIHNGTIRTGNRLAVHTKWISETILLV
jgi:hypothetical protein